MTTDRRQGHGPVSLLAAPVPFLTGAKVTAPVSLLAAPVPFLTGAKVTAPVSLLATPVPFLTSAKAMAPVSLLATPVLALGLRLVRSGAAHVAVRSVTPKKISVSLQQVITNVITSRPCRELENCRNGGMPGPVSDTGPRRDAGFSVWDA